MAIEVKKSRKLIDYNLALKFLEKRVEDVINGKKPELLWILEHKPIFTAGTSYKENEILNKSINLIKTSRGGKITYHGPGQKVAYFVLNLNDRGKDIKKLIRCIEKCIIQILKEYKIKSFNDKKNMAALYGGYSTHPLASHLNLYLLEKKNGIWKIVYKKNIEKS